MPNQVAFQEITKQLKETNGRLVAVSKFKSVADIRALYDLGQRDFGENYVQELAEKAPQLPLDIRWHFIGHLQSNKVKYIAPFISMIQSVDSFKLLKEINRQGQKNKKVIPCLIQIYVADETTKFGLDEKGLVEFMEFYEAQKQDLGHVTVAGLMGMASFTGELDQLHREFFQLKSLFEFCKSSYFIGDKGFHILSMGMSNDYQEAIACGSNMLRIGSLLFGNR
jgi:pyridoxal phosphate enzyme (YggS family)